MLQIRLMAAFCAMALFSPNVRAQTSPDYREPAYVYALVVGEIDRLASFDALQWNPEITSRRVPGDLLGDAAIDRILRLQQAGPAPQQSAGLAAAQAWADRAALPLESTFIRRHIFRYHYILAFAQKLDGTCRFLDKSTAREAAAAINAAVRYFALDTMTEAKARELEPENRLAHKSMHMSIFAGRTDADLFSRKETCQSDRMKAVMRSLTKLLAPVALTSEATKSRDELELAAIVRRTPEYLVAGRYFLPNKLKDAYSSAFRASEQGGSLRIPDISEESPGRTIGWFTDGAVLKISMDDKPFLFVLTNADQDCTYCRTMVQDYLTSKQLNALAGRFHAVILVANDDPESFFGQIKNLLKAELLPAVYLVELGTAQTPAKLLLARKLSAPSVQLSMDLAPLIAPPTAGLRTSGGGHEASRRLPSACWKIDSWELCQARLRRNARGE